VAHGTALAGVVGGREAGQRTDCGRECFREPQHAHLRSEGLGRRDFGGQPTAGMGVAVIDRNHGPVDRCAGRRPGELLQLHAQRVFAVWIVGRAGSQAIVLAPHREDDRDLDGACHGLQEAARCDQLDGDLELERRIHGPCRRGQAFGGRVGTREQRVRECDDARLIFGCREVEFLLGVVNRVGREGMWGACRSVTRRRLCGESFAVPDQADLRANASCIPKAMTSRISATRKRGSPRLINGSIGYAMVLSRAAIL
jgi:hypothetical protein